MEADTKTGLFVIEISIVDIFFFYFKQNIGQRFCFEIWLLDFKILLKNFFS